MPSVSPEAAGGFLSRIQPKLTIGRSNDRYEHEADQVAEYVIGNQAGSAPAITPIGAGGLGQAGGTAQKLSVQRQDEDEQDNLKTKLLQRVPMETPDEEEAEDTPVQRLCDSCVTEYEAATDEEKPNTEQPPVQTKESRVNGISGPISAAIQNPVPGVPLNPHTQRALQAGLDFDLSRVRVHSDSASQHTARALKARAFTHGRDIWLGPGESQSDTKLMAHEATHVVQQRTAVNNNQEAVHSTEEKIQTYPQAGEQLPSTDKMADYYSYRNDIVDIQGEGTFNPGRGLGNYIASLWENRQDAPVNIKFGSLASGYIYVKQSGGYYSKECLTVPLSLLIWVKTCKDIPPESVNYSASLQVIPLEHDAFEKNDKGSLVLVVGITNGFIYGKLGWIEGKQAGEIEPLLDAASAVTNEEAFLPLIYGDEYDGQNYTSIYYENQLSNGVLSFFSRGVLDLANQQKIEGKLGLINSLHVWSGNLKGKAIGLEEHQFPIDRNAKAELHGDSTELVLDKEWTSGDKTGEDGVFTQGQLRASYKNGTFDFFGKATYLSARIKGEVNIAITSESEAQELFAQHAPAEKVRNASGSIPTNTEDSSKEPLALTAWGNLTFKLIDKKDTPATNPQGQKDLLTDLEGEGAFIVSPEGYIILSGKLKFLTEWKFTNKHDYRSDDAEDESKHLFQKEITVAKAWVPFGTIGLQLGIKIDAYAHIEPLELYEIEISGVYSNHPDYRSEVDITPRFYIEGHAGAKITVSGVGAYKLGGIFTIGEVSGDIEGNAQAKAYIDAAPTIKTIWNKDKETPASYAIAGTIHSGGKLTFALSGSINVRVLKAEILKTEDYHIGSWTIGSFGLVLNLNEYAIGSGEKPKIDYRKIGFEEKQRQNLGNSIASKKEGKEGGDKRTGGFQQIEGGKAKEKGEFSITEPVRKDLGSEEITKDLEEEFLMLDKLHELVLTFSGTRDAPEVLLEMSSDEKLPLEDRIRPERYWIVADNPDAPKEQQLQMNDLDAIETEANSVKKNAKEAAQKVQGDEEPVVAGFDRLDDRLNSYAKKYNKNDLGVSRDKSAIASSQQFKVPKSNGASAEMEQRLKEKREEIGYQNFENFKGSNVAVFRYYILKPGANQIDKNADGPFYEAAVNVAKELHSEMIIAGRLQKIHESKVRKKYGPAYIIAVDQILSERSPCGECWSFLGNQPSRLIVTSNYHTYYLERYSGDWITRNRNLMIRYGLQPPSLEDLQKQYGGGRNQDPH